MIKVVDLLAVDFMQEAPRNKCIIFYLFVVKRKYQQFKKSHGSISVCIIFLMIWNTECIKSNIK